MGRKRKKRTDWKAKVHPAFLDLAKLYRELAHSLRAIQGNPSRKAVSKIHTQALNGLVEIRKRFRHWPDGVDSVYSMMYVTPPKVRLEEAVRQPESAHFTGLLEWLAWKRCRQPFWQIAQEDAAGNREASKKIERIIAEGNKLRYGEKLPGFKYDLDHAGLLEMGLPLGLDKLTSEELADCFEEVCACGKHHSADNLKKQRKRLLEAIETAVAWQRNLTGGTQARLSQKSTTAPRKVSGRK